MSQEQYTNITILRNAKRIYNVYHYFKETFTDKKGNHVKETTAISSEMLM